MGNDVSTVIIGMGNEFRSDDSVGLMVARKIRELKLDHVKIMDGVSDSTSLIEAWNNADQTFIIDAVESKSRPGRVFRFDAFAEDIPEELFVGYSTHAFSLRDTIHLGQVLGSLPKRLIIYGIEGKNFSPGGTLSYELEDSLSSLVDLVLKDMSNYGKSGEQFRA